MEKLKMQFANWLNMMFPWFLAHGIKIIVILIAAVVLNRIAIKLIEKAVRLAVLPDPLSSPEGEKKREDTLIAIFSATIKIVILLIVCMMVLQEVGIMIGPLLAGAGIVGLALGFGGQYLIRDLISGLFIILENQYRI